MTDPLVSIVMPVYNCEAYVNQAIDSILSQTYKNFELIIVNDASSDDTPFLLKQYKDPRISIVNNSSNLKIAKSLNIGIQSAKGKYIARMDGDDISLPTRIELQVKFLEKNSDIDIVGTNIFLIDRSNRPQGKLPESPQFPVNHKIVLARQSTMAHPTVMLRKDSIGDHLFYSDQYPHAEDYELWLRLNKLGFKSSNLKNYLLKYRLHPKSISQINYHQANDSMIKAIEKHNPLELDNEANPYLTKLIRKPQLIKTDEDLQSVLKHWALSKEKHIKKYNYTQEELVELYFFEKLFFLQLGFYQLLNRRKIPLNLIALTFLNQISTPLPASLKLMKSIYCYFFSKHMPTPFDTLRNTFNAPKDKSARIEVP